MSDRGKAYSYVKEVIIENFGRKIEPQRAIREAAETRLDENNLLEILEQLDALYTRAEFNEEA